MVRKLLAFLFVALFALACSSSGGKSDEDTVDDTTQADVQPDESSDDTGPQPDLVEHEDVAETVDPDVADVSEPEPEIEEVEEIEEIDPEPEIEEVEEVEDVQPEEVEPEVVQEPVVQCYVVTSGGNIGVGNDIISLQEDDEPLQYQDTPGFQVDVGAQTVFVESGQTATLTVGGASIGEEAVFTDAVTGLGTVTFTNVTLAPTADGYELSVSATNAGGKTGDCVKTMLVDSGVCPIDVTPMPEEGACVLTDDDEDTAGFQMTFDIASPNSDCTTASLKYRVGGLAWLDSETVALTDGQASVTITVDDGRALNAVLLEAQAFISNPDVSLLDNQTNIFGYLIDTVDPVVTVFSPTAEELAQISSADDVAPTSSGIQVTFSGDVSGINLDMDGNNTVALTSAATDESGAPLIDTSMALSSQTFQFIQVPFLFPEDVDTTLTFAATDACGRTGSLDIPVSVFAHFPTLSITSPAVDATLLAIEDGDAETPSVYETTFTLEATDLPTYEDTTITVSCAPADSPASLVSVGEVVALAADLAAADPAGSGSFDVAVSLDVETLGDEIVCQATHGYINATTSSAVSLTLGIPAPTLTITKPDGEKPTSKDTLTIEATASGLNGMDLDLIVTADADGAEVANLPAFAAVQTGGLFYLLDTSTFADGLYTLAIDGVDAFGNQLSTHATTTAGFQIDRTDPGLTLVTPAPDAYAVTDADTPDENTDLKGFQTSYTFEVTFEDPVVGARVCMRSNAGQLRCELVADEDGTITFADVTLVAGANPLTARVTDVAGNAIDDQAWTITRVTDMPRVDFVEPAMDMSITHTDLTVRVAVTDVATGEAVVDPNVILFVNGVEAGTSTTLVDGAYGFDVILEEGTAEIQAKAVVDTVTAYSFVRRVTYTTALPSATITSHADDFVLNAAAEGCALGATDCVTTVTADTSNADDGLEATLEVLCNGEEATYAATITDAVLSFEDVVLADQHMCTLTITIIDVNGQELQAAVIDGRVDRVAPRFLGHNVPAYVGAKHDHDPFADGVQFPVSITYSGLEVGQLVTLTVTPVEGEATSAEATVELAASDDETASVAFAQMTLPTGHLTMRVEAEDAAANTALDGTSEDAEPPAFLAFECDVNPDESMVWLETPQFVDDLSCTTNDECGEGTCVQGGCFLVWNKEAAKNIVVKTQGISFDLGGTDNIRICSDNADVTGDTCETAGYKVLALVTLPSNNVTVPVPDIVDGKHNLIAEGLADPIEGTWVSSADEAIEIDAEKRFRRVFVDTVAPTVASLVASSDTNGDNKLSAAEAAGDGSFQITVTTSEAGSVKLFVDELLSATSDIDADGVDLAIALDEDTSSLTAKAVDLYGNEGELSEALVLFVDTKSPDLTFVNPAKAILTQDDSADAVLTSNAQGIEVELFNDGLSVGTATSGADYRATFTNALSEDDTYVLSATATDSVGNQTSATPQHASILVDRTPPVLVVTTPAMDATVQDNDEASAGYQILFTFSTTGAEEWRLWVSKNCDETHATCDEAAMVKSGDISNSDGEQTIGSYTLPGAQTAYYKLAFRAFDDHDNMSEVMRDITVDLSGCSVWVENLPSGAFINNEICATAGSDCASGTFDVEARYSCPNATDIELYAGGLVVGTGAITGGVATIPYEFTDGTQVSVAVKALDGAQVVMAESSAVDYTVDLTSPVVKFIADSVLGFDTPGTGSSNLYGLGSDQDPGQDDLQVHMSLTSDDTNLAGGEFQALTSTVGEVSMALTPNVPSLPVLLDSVSYAVEIQSVTLAHGVHTVEAVVLDAAGNAGKASFTADVDLLPPEAVDLVDLTAADVNRRLPSVDLTWQAPGDDGATGTATGYEVRFSRFSIESDADFAEACLAASITAMDDFVLPSEAGTVETITVYGPDARDPDVQEYGQPCKFVTGSGDTTYYFAVRALDDAGNGSDVVSDSVDGTVSTSLINLRQAIVEAEDAVGDVGVEIYVTGLGDVNADGFDDYTAYSFTPSVACVFLGRSDGTDAATIPDITLATMSSTTHYCYEAQATGSDVGNMAAGLGDINGDGINDFAFGQKVDGSDRVDVYLGVDTAAEGQPELPTSPFLTITGQQSSAAYGSIVAAAGDFNGDGLDDIAVASTVANVVYLILGQSDFTGGDTPMWAAGSAPLTLDLTDELSYGGMAIVRITYIGWSDPTTFFGSRIAATGNMLPDEGEAQYGDIAIRTTRNPNRVYVVKGRATPNAITDISISTLLDDSGSDDDSAVLIGPEQGVTALAFATDLSSGHDLDGRGTPDLVIGHAAQVPDDPSKPYSVYVIYGEEIGGFLGGHVWGVDLPDEPVVSSDGVLVGARGVILSGAYDYVSIIGDFDGAGQGNDSADLAMTPFSANYSQYGQAWIRLNHADETLGLSFGGFPWQDVTVLPPPDVVQTAAFGYTAIGIGDFNNDGHPDLYVSTLADGYAVIAY
jgi:hypothetical protein